MDSIISPIGADQRISSRIISPYLRESSSIGVSGTYKIEISPTKLISPDDRTYEFEIPELDRSLYDLKNILLLVRGKVQKKLVSGAITTVPSSEAAILGTNSLHTLFSSVSVSIGRNQERFYQANHNYKAYMKQILDLKYKKTAAAQLAGFGYEVMTTAGDDLANATGREKPFEESAEVEFLGETQIDIFNTVGFLQSGVPVRIQYTRSEPRFYMLVGKVDKLKTYRFDIKKILLYVPVIKITDSLQPYLSTLCEKSPSRYFFQSCDLKLFNIAADTSIFEVPKLYSGRLPTRLLVAFYPASSVAGTTL